MYNHMSHHPPLPSQPPPLPPEAAPPLPPPIPSLSPPLPPPSFEQVTTTTVVSGTPYKGHLTTRDTFLVPF